MASLNQLVSEFAHAVGNPNSIPLRRNLRYAILHGRNELIHYIFVEVEQVLVQVQYY